MGAAATRARERSGAGLRVLQQQQPDERGRPGSGRCGAAAEAARRGARPGRVMRILAVTHGPLVQPELFADVLHRGRARADRLGDRATRARRRRTATTRFWSSAATRTSARSSSTRGCTRSTTRCAGGWTTARRCSACASARRRSPTRSARACSAIDRRSARGLLRRRADRRGRRRSRARRRCRAASRR